MELMSTRLSKADSYTVESLTGLARRCDWFINGNELVKNTSSDPKTIFLTAYRGNTGIPFLVSSVVPTLKSSVVLIIASEDYTFPHGLGDVRSNMYIHCQPEIEFLLNSKLISHIFVENLDTKHSKLTPIPLGIHPSFDKNYTDIFNSNIKLTLDRSILVFCCHRVHTWGPKQFIDRGNVSELSKTVWKDFVDYSPWLPTNQFRDKLLTSKFTICVHGGGLDPSPRAWEALLCGSIPIMKHSTLDEAYSRFPIFYIDDWKSECLNKEDLDKWWDSNYKNINHEKVLEMLSMDYWWNIISSDLPAK
jgi:hypothetical protein